MLGRGIFDSVQNARIARTRWFFERRGEFMAQLVSEIDRAYRHALKRGYSLAIRLNATSDIPWHRVAVNGRPNLMAIFPLVQFYDYTKLAKRLFEPLPANYHLTFSVDGTNDTAVDAVIAAGKNVAVVFRNRALVESLLGKAWRGATVIDGDETDLRFLDAAGSIVALYAKGPAKQDTSGFVRDC